MNKFYDQEKQRIEEIMPAYKALATHSSFIINFCNNKNSKFKTIKSHKKIINRPFFVEAEEEFFLKNIEDVIEQFLNNTPEFIEAFEISEKYRKGTPLTQEEIDILNKNEDYCVLEGAVKINAQLEPLFADVNLCEKFANDSYMNNKKKLELLNTARPTNLLTDIALKNCKACAENAIDILSEPVNNYHEAFTSTYAGFNFTELAINEYIRNHSSIENARFSEPINPSQGFGPNK